MTKRSEWTASEKLHGLRALSNVVNAQTRMPRLLKTIIRWTVIQFVLGPIAHWLAGNTQLQVGLWKSYAVYVLAGREAARHGRLWHAAVAAVTINLIENLIFRISGAPHPRPDFSWQADALVSLFVMLLAGAWGFAGGFFGWIARRRANNDESRHCHTTENPRVGAI